MRSGADDAVRYGTWFDHVAIKQLRKFATTIRLWKFKVPRVKKGYRGVHARSQSALTEDWYNEKNVSGDAGIGGVSQLGRCRSSQSSLARIDTSKTFVWGAKEL